MTPLRLEHFHSAPVSNCRCLLCSAHTGRNSFAKRGTGYSAESLTIAGSVEAFRLPSPAFRGSRTERVCWGRRRRALRCHADRTSNTP
jgi:hypothetical protein